MWSNKSSGYFPITNVNSRLCLTAEGDGSVDTRTCSGATTQLWTYSSATGEIQVCEGACF